MSKVLVIGCGGVASVAIQKCCQVSEVFTELCIASRTKSKCDKLAAELAPKTATKITTAQVDADDVNQVIDLIKAYGPDLVMNIALPYHCLLYTSVAARQVAVVGDVQAEGLHHGLPLLKIQHIVLIEILSLIHI